MASWSAQFEGRHCVLQVWVGRSEKLKYCPALDRDRSFPRAHSYRLSHEMQKRRQPAAVHHRTASRASALTQPQQSQRT